ncbi:methyltransferase domain-containing protein [Desulfobacter curvatus]|uniref:methyltransferase domain-containing protein n=1 Tax=Desulfobacter curvatus TaxID=2290 RepID=UPI00037944E2|nr:methyltransferase domain-containing protein [Desulfobacter curvatus]
MELSVKDAAKLFRCPVNKDILELKEDYLISKSGLKYPVVNGIIDLLPEEKRDDNDNSEYDTISGLLYNLWVMNPIIISFAWGIGALTTLFKMKRLLEIPGGWILDVPCGTGIFSTSVYKSKPASKFIAMDYSMGMLKAAQKKARSKNIRNVIFIRADVGNLPFKDNSIDGSFSMAGFHAFPDPNKAALEIGRILKKTAPFTMTVACAEERTISDFMIRKFMIPKGYFKSSFPPHAYRKLLRNNGLRDIHAEMAGAIMVSNAKKLD